ncbi:hypothetical protein HCN44_005995 [Aphidius gifuensis]|uniref:VWFA domain-containing protein n=1 Tax=Aphidius gifuensis TaxID=684658 RepID=A0A835CUW4_APHGI|nr:integrator complex subunit 6-A [Aphidius gifuensis]KAF7997424.1 hypothetical protein HCN44_005995 [Aphidius gifuensis]
MTIIVFLIDTSASMNQRAYSGGRPTLLDVAKSAVETFVKMRQRSPESRGDRYMLLTYEDPPNNIKAGWKENLATFMNELKNLQGVGLTTLGAALKHALDVLNINRMQTGIDTYGQGRSPFYLEPSVIVLITDGGKYTTSSGVQQEFTLPMHSPILGSELTKEPFRWDQRLFSLVLRLSGTPAIDRDIGLVASDTSPIDAMCEITGGRSYCVTSNRMMLQCIDSLVQKVQSGVVINFEKIGPDPPPLSTDLPQTLQEQQEQQQQQQQQLQQQQLQLQLQSNNEICDNDDDNSSNTIINGIRTSQYLPTPTNVGNTAWHSCRRLIYVPRSAQKGFAVGFWPIPESFWPDLSASSLPPRSAHPNVKFTCTSQEPMVIENLPFDKYELEPSPLTQFILARKQPTTCWQVFVANSYKSSEVGHPFGYLKASTNLTCVNLFVMPYNYPVLLPLLEELFKVHRLKPTNEWRTQFANYMRTMPTYYAISLRRALLRMGAAAPLAQTLVPDTLDNSLSYSVMNYLKRLKNQAKLEFERLCNEVISKQVATANANVNGSTTTITEGVRVIPKVPLKKDLISHPLLQDKFTGLRDQLNEFGGFVVGLVKNQQQQKGAHSYRNAFDVPRKSLLDQVVRMRANFLQPGLLHTKLLDDDYVHSMPVAQMGNYQEYLKKMTPPLREIESVPVRQHMFGNPFKIDKRMMVDEADMDIVGSPSSSNSNNNNNNNNNLNINNTNAGSTSVINSNNQMVNNLGQNSIPISSVLTSNIPNKNSLKRPLDNIGNNSPLLTRSIPNKRKPGPIPKEVVIRRPLYNNNVKPLTLLNLSTSPVPWNQADTPAPKSPTLPPPEINAFTISSSPPMSSVTIPSPEPITIPVASSLAPLSSSTTSSPLLPAPISPLPLSTLPSSLLPSLTPPPLSLPVATTTAITTTITITTTTATTSRPVSPAILIDTDNISTNSFTNSSITIDKLTNGLSDTGMSSTTAYEPLPVEINDNHNDLPIIPRVAVNNISSSLPKNDCQINDNINNIVQDVCMKNQNNVNVEEKNDNKMSNHVEHKKVDQVFSKKELEEVRKHNLSIRELVHKEVRRKGTNHTTLFSHIHQVKGTLDIRIAFVREIVKESLRFKRRNLAKLLEEYLSSVQENEIVMNMKELS